MTGPLGEDLDAALGRFADAGGPLLLALDFDGVCAPLVDDPTASRMLPGTRQALTRLTGDGCLVALVSGRALGSLRELARPEDGWLLVGSHGAEHGTGEREDRLEDALADLLADVTAEVERLVAAHPGSGVEHKPTAVVLHTRRAAPDVAGAVTAAVLDGPGAREGVHVKRGHDVVELTVVEADKGTALLGLRERTGAAAVLYAGDDLTDEDAFAVLDPAAGDVTVKVGDGDTAAACRVGTPEDVTALLERLHERLHDGLTGP